MNNGVINTGRLIRRALQWCGLAVCVGWLQTASAEELIVGTTLTNNEFTELLNKFRPPANTSFEATYVNVDQLTADLLLNQDTGLVPDVVIIPTYLLTLPGIEYETLPASWAVAGIPHKYRLQGAVKGRWLGAPVIAGNHLMLYFNKGLVGKPAESWDKVAESHAASNNTVAGWAYNEPYWFIPFLSVFGALPLHEQGTVADNLARTLEYYRDLGTRGIVSPECNYNCTTELFMKGKLPYMIDGSWSYNKLKLALGDNIGVAPLPAFGNRSMHSYNSTYVVAIPRRVGRTSAEKWDLIREFVAYTRSMEMQSAMWEQAKLLPVLTPEQNDLLLAGNPGLDVILKEMGQTTALPNSERMSTVWDALSLGFQYYSADVMNAEEASQFIINTIHQ